MSRTDNARAFVKLIWGPALLAVALAAAPLATTASEVTCAEVGCGGSESCEADGTTSGGGCHFSCQNLIGEEVVETEHLHCDPVNN